MNRKRYLILTTMLSLLCMNKTYAACTQEEINEFKKVEDEYKITYEFNLTTKDYTLNIYSPLPDKFDYILYMTSDLVCKNIDNNTVECTKAPPGKHKIEIVGQTETCKDVLKTYTIELPKYNKYAEDSLCQGIEEFVLCQPTYDKEIDYDTFVSRVNTYKRTKKTVEEETEKEEDNKITKYFKDNFLEIIIIIVFIILVAITTILTVKSIRKSRRLE